MLLIDSGNSAIKTRHLVSGLKQDRVFPIRDGFEQSGFAEYLSSLSEQQVYSASVASTSVKQTLNTLIRQYLPQADHQQLQTLPELAGVTNAYTQYQQLGVDRWLTLMAVSGSEQDTIIIDAGSAITIDLLSQQLGHLGGAILPGFNTSLERFCSLFPHVDFNSPEIDQTEKPGRSTAGCINIKMAPVSVEWIASIVQLWTPLLKSPVETLVTGQDANRIASHPGLPSRCVPDLVFSGMLKQIQCLR